MSRPKPTILLEITDKKTYKTQQILKAQGVYSVYYDGAPMSVRIKNAIVDYPPAKYTSVNFPSPGHAFNLAEKLNTLFKTDKFEVYLLTEGQKIIEEK